MVQARPSGSQAIHFLADPPFRWLVSAFGVLVSLSGVQLWVHSVVGGRSSSFAYLFVGNLVASLPWLPLAFVALRLVRRFPPTHLRHLAAHLATSALVSFGFLAWLALFHLLVSPGSRSYLAWLKLDLGEFFSVGVLIYWVVAAAGHAFQLARKQSAEEAAPVLEPAPIVVRSTGRTRLVEPAKIDWIEGAGSYVRLHVGSRSHLHRQSLTDLASRLSEQGFARIHRSTVVNLTRIVEVRRRSHGEAMVVLADGRELKVSRTFKDSLSSLGL